MTRGVLSAMRPAAAAAPIVPQVPCGCMAPRSDEAAARRVVLYHHLLAPRFGQLVRQAPRDRVGAAAFLASTTG